MSSNNTKKRKNTSSRSTTARKNTSTKKTAASGSRTSKGAGTKASTSRSTGTRSTSTKSASARSGGSARRNNKRRQEIRNRVRTILIAIIVIMLVILAIFGISKLAGGGKLPETSTLTVNVDGTIVLEEVATIDEEEDYSDAKEYTNELIDDYNTSGAGGVTLNKYKTKSDTVYVKTSYTSYSTYADFTGYDMYSGSIGSYYDMGGELAGTFCKVEDGVKSDQLVQCAEFDGEDTLKLLMVKENITVKVPGTIRYVSSENTTVTGTDTVVIAPADGNTDVAAATYIIYE